ncbi:MFS transporter [Kribbella deserti]|uniref:MFS transporter n=1 Tax=Kribbella deserti TaxID=1926257 RepID=A0ABV6QHJ0_9ACTN
MKAQREALALLVGGGVADFAFRVSQVAFPLVVLTETGSVAATGLAGAAAGVPVVLSPWWARKARQWVDSGARLAVISAVASLALAMVPAAAMAGVLEAWVLIASGLLLGTCEALSTPGRSALLADTGDRWGPDKAVELLTWQDGLRRIGMLVGPSLGALAVTAGFTEELLWLEALAVVSAGLLAAAVRGNPRSLEIQEAPSIRAALVGRRDVLLGWIARGTGCVTWFAFTLGLSVLGAQRDRPGIYLAYGMTGYGVGAVAASVFAVHVVRRLPPAQLAGGAWVFQGLCWVGMGLWAEPPAIAAFACLGGVSVVLGIAAISAVITRSSVGPERRALLSGQSVVVNAGSAAGLLVGGPLIAVFGAESVLVGSGLLTSLVAGSVLLASRKTQASPRKPQASPSPECETADHVDRDHHPGRAA